MFGNTKRKRIERQLNKSASDLTLFQRLKNTIDAPRYEKNELLEVYTRSPWLRAVTSKIARSVANVGFEIYKGDRKIKNSSVTKFMSEVNPVLMTTEILQLIQLWLDLVGEAYLVKERSASGKPVELWAVLPLDVLSLPTQGSDYFKIRTANGVMEVPKRDVIVFKDMNPQAPYGKGSGTGYALGDEIDIDNYSTKHIKNFFYNKAVPDILITGKEDGDITEIDAKRLEKKWLEKNQGFMKSYKPYFLSKSVEIHKLSQSFDNMQLVSLRKNERDSIIQVFGVPPEILGIIENSNRATIDAADYLYTKHVIKPRLDYLEQVLSNFLKTEFGVEYSLKFNSPIPLDLEYRKKIFEEFPSAFTINEIREEVGLDKLDSSYGTSFYQDIEANDEGGEEDEGDE